MSEEKERKVIVISLGGSLVYPDERGINLDFIEKFNNVLVEYCGKKCEARVVVGGGYLARANMREARGRGITSNYELDLIGIEATRCNAEQVRSRLPQIDFPGRVYPKVVDKFEKRVLTHSDVVIYCGGVPGHSTDYDAVRIAELEGSNRMINMSNVSHVYDGDPKKNGNARKLNEIKWERYMKMLKETCGDEWKAGMNSPFDPIASRKAMECGIEVFVIGSDLENLRKVLEGKEFEGTRIYC